MDSDNLKMVLFVLVVFGIPIYLIAGLEGVLTILFGFLMLFLIWFIFFLPFPFK